MDGNPSDIAFYFDLVEFYHKNKKLLDRKLKTRKESDLLDFCCMGHSLFNNTTYSHLVTENIYKLAYVFSSTIGKQLPQHIHNRIVLGHNNFWAKKYVDYVKDLKPYWLFNNNKNEFNKHRLSTSGSLTKLMMK